MTSISATVQGGRLEVDVPAEWPDGTRVEIHALETGLSREADSLSAEEIAATLAAIDAIEPVELSNHERAAWDLERKERKEREKSEFMKHADELRKHWE